MGTSGKWHQRTKFKLLENVGDILKSCITMSFAYILYSERMWLVLSLSITQHVLFPACNVPMQLRSDLENDLLDAQSQIEELKQFVSNQGKVRKGDGNEDLLLSISLVFLTVIARMPVKCVCMCVSVRTHMHAYLSLSVCFLSLNPSACCHDPDYIPT